MKTVHTVYGSTGTKLATITKDDYVPTTPIDNINFLILLANSYNIPFVLKANEVIFTQANMHEHKNIIVTNLEK